MRIGINLVGVSFEDGSIYRYRNYRDASDDFFEKVVNPLREQGHDVVFYLYTYDSIETENILNTYTPVIKSKFINPNINHIDDTSNIYGIKHIMGLNYLNSLNQLKDEKLDLVISTRYDIKFFRNPFEEYRFDFSKLNFLWREPAYPQAPIVNDTFIVFPYDMLDNVINSIITMQINPPLNILVGMHNWYLPMVQEVGKERVQWLDDRFVGVEGDSRTPHANTLYQLTRRA